MGGRRLPERIILVRHGESAGNLDTSAYSTTPDHQIPLTAQGRRQAREAGRAIRRMLDEEKGKGSDKGWGAYFYVSPYERTRSTLREMGRAFPFPSPAVLGAREECRIREQDFGNFQVLDRMRAIQEARQRFGRFFFRFPDGESAADVYDRVASFLESLWRDIDMNRLCAPDPDLRLNLIIVTHGLTSRVFLMKWFKWTVHQFELLNNPANCEFRVMQLCPTGEYSLLIHHSPDELRLWGLSPEMIADQHCRATSTSSSPNHFDFGGYLTSSFFHHSDADADASDDDDPHPLSPSLPHQHATTHKSC